MPRRRVRDNKGMFLREGKIKLVPLKLKTMNLVFGHDRAHENKRWKMWRRLREDERRPQCWGAPRGGIRKEEICTAG